MQNLRPLNRLRGGIILIVLAVCVTGFDRASGQLFVWGDGSYGQTNVPALPTNVLSMAAGDAHCLALLADRTVVTWGGNYAGQTNVPTDVTNVIAIGAGATHSAGIEADGTLRLWGKIYYGVTNVPADLTNAVAVAVGPGGQHAVAMRADGSLVDWGSSVEYAPLLTNFPVTATNLVSIAAGSLHTLALRSDGRVVAWGVNDKGQINVPASATNVIAIATGWRFSAALRADGKVLTWGQTHLLYPGDLLPPTAASNVVELACGGNHVMALRRDGKLIAWGNSSFGQTSVPGAATNLAVIAGGGYCSLATVGSGPPLFTGPPLPRTVASGQNAFLRLTAVGAWPLSYQWSFNGTNLAGATNSFVMVTNAQPIQSGHYVLTVTNALGAVTNTNVLLTILPVMVTNQPQSQSAYSGTNVTFTVAATGVGAMSYQWLLNETNILGATNATLTVTNVQPSDSGSYSVIVSNSLGSTISSSATLTVVPILIKLPPQSQVAFRGANVTFSIVAQSSQVIDYRWKFNEAELPGETSNMLILTNVQYDQAGMYSVVASNQLATVPVAGARLSVVPVAAWGGDAAGETDVPADLTNVVALAGGSAHSLALRSDGTVAVWGYQDERTDVSLLPTNMVAIASGRGHNLALGDDGTVTAWGDDTYGQADVPTGLNQVVAVAGGAYFSAALRTDGTVVEWGRGDQGQTNVPPDLTNIVSISCGSTHVLALRDDGKVFAWGYNGSGQTNVPADLSNVVAIAAGSILSVALKADGTVVQWGSTSYSPKPAAATNIIAIAAGYGHVLALNADGKAFAWGYYYNGETNVPPTLRNVTVIAAGESHGLALVGHGPPVLHVPATNPSLSTNGFSLSLPSQSGRVYRLEYVNSLNESTWTALPLSAGNRGALTLTDPTATNAGERFYRVKSW